jgi:hypothetical protein
LVDFSAVQLFLEDSLEGEGHVEVASTDEELALEFDPVETKRVKEALEDVHLEQYSESHSHEGEPNNERGQGNVPDGVLLFGGPVPWDLEDLLEEYKGKLGVGEGESPKTKVGGGVGDAAKNKFNCLNHLMDEQLTYVMMSSGGTELLHEHDLKLSQVLLIVGFSIYKLARFSFTGNLLELVAHRLLVMVLGTTAEGDAGLNTEVEGHGNHDHNNEGL